MSKADSRVVAGVMAAIGRLRTECARRPLVIGICGAQGSGKSTLAEAVRKDCEARGISCAVLSIDDLYLTRQERQALARAVHPLLATRGPPGTHDIALGLSVIAALENGEPCALPRFDKATDDRVPHSQWPQAPQDCAVLILEGWCVGAKAQDERELTAPVNALEAQEDADGTWRRFVNASLAGRYCALFARIDWLMLLAAPGFDVVAGWRMQQERELAARSGDHAPGVMDAAGVDRFVGYYERLTRHILSEMPSRADMVARIDRDRHVLEVIER